MAHGFNPDPPALARMYAPQVTQSAQHVLGFKDAEAAGVPAAVALPTEVEQQYVVPVVAQHTGVGKEARLGQPAPRGQLWPRPQPAPPPDEGDSVSFDLNAPGGLVTVDASVLLVSSSLVICLDRTTDPNLTLDASALQEIADGFEHIVLPRLRVFFGQESDVNADGHVTVLFSPLVADTGTAYVNPYDLVTDPGSRPPGVAANDRTVSR